MRVLVGSTGFVGSTLSLQAPFDVAVHRSDLERIRGLQVDEIVCAGLPAAKYLANAHPEDDWENVRTLAETLSTVRADRFVLVSTVDVYQPPRDVTEADRPAYGGEQAYGRHRAWFEAFVRSEFSDHVVVRLPGLFGTGLRKNLVFDLLEGREEQWASVDARSTFQFVDVAKTLDYAERARQAGTRLLNLATEPVTAQAVADLFGVRLPETGRTVHYDVRTVHAGRLGHDGDYLESADEQLAGIGALRAGWRTAGATP